jgi:hypothetical protein
MRKEKKTIPNPGYMAQYWLLAEVLPLMVAQMVMIVLLSETNDSYLLRKRN